MVKNGDATSKIASIKRCLRVYLEQNVCAGLEMKFCNKCKEGAMAQNFENPKQINFKLKSVVEYGSH